MSTRPHRSQRVGKVPSTVAKWVQYVLGFGVSVAIGLAPFLGKVNVPLFTPMLSLIPQSIQDIAIPISATAMGIVAVVVQWYGAEHLQKSWLQARFFQTLAICVAALATLTAIEMLAVIRIDVPAVGGVASFAVGVVHPHSEPCVALSRADCVRILTFDEAKVASYFGEMQVNLTKLTLVLTYTVFMCSFGSLVGLLMLAGRLK